MNARIVFCLHIIHLRNPRNLREKKLKKSFVHSLRRISDFVVEKIFPQITQITQIDIHKKSFVHSLRRISDFMARKNIPADHADHAD